MEEEVVVKIADAMLTPLGRGTGTNYQAVKAGRTCVSPHEGIWQLPFALMAGFVDDALISACCKQLRIGEGYTRFEKMALIAMADALRQCDIDTSAPSVRLILSTTKGNVHLLEQPTADEQALSPVYSATKLAQWMDNENTPLVVSNACISGLHAQLEAYRLLRSGEASTVVVVAADMLSPFIVSGFQAFHALSEKPCRPFDEERLGLNLGEAAACAIYQRQPRHTLSPSAWTMGTGSVYNDAYHISHPSRTAEGSYRALTQAMGTYQAEDITMVNVHGTATLYNDEMEAVALQRAGLNAVPINSLKGYFGHTMGAAGLLETLITMRALDDHTILGTKGYHELGVSKPVNISAQHRTADGKRFIKLISGFGGCNAAIRFETATDA